MRRIAILSLLLWAGLAVGNVSASSTEQGSVPTVFVTRSGRSYHLPSCRFLAMSRKSIPLARVTGRYKPCTYCHPPLPEGAAEPEARAHPAVPDTYASALER
jgi:hypothetical protein